MIVTGYKIDQFLDKSHQFQLGITEKEDEHRLKVKFAERSSVPIERQMLLKNIFSLLKELAHQNIPKAIDFRTDKTHIALITEFVEGVSITELTKEKPLTSEESVRTAVDIARILDYLYGKKIIHQSISPSNVIRSVEGAAYLINFDKASNQEELAQEKVPVRLLPYEPDYCAPEQTGRVNRKIDYRTDYYGLGMVMYKMLTGKKPFESKDPLEMVHAQIAKVPEPVEKLAPDTPPAVSRIVAKLIACDNLSIVGSDDRIGYRNHNFKGFYSIRGCSRNSTHCPDPCHCIIGTHTCRTGNIGHS